MDREKMKKDIKKIYKHLFDSLAREDKIG